MNLCVFDVELGQIYVGYFFTWKTVAPHVDSEYIMLFDSDVVFKFFCFIYFRFFAHLKKLKLKLKSKMLNYNSKDHNHGCALHRACILEKKYEKLPLQRFAKNLQKISEKNLLFLIFFLIILYYVI